MSKQVVNLTPNFDTIGYMNEHLKCKAMIPADLVSGARVMTTANDLYKEYLGEADDNKARTLKNLVKAEAEAYNAVVQNPETSEEDGQRALMLWAHSLHLWEKMAI